MRVAIAVCLSLVAMPALAGGAPADDGVRQELQRQLDETARRMERGQHAPATAQAEAYGPHCEPIAKIKETVKEAKFTPMTAGQVHFLYGLYAASPITPDGLPPGNGALLMEVKGKFSGIIWTRGKEGCVMPIAINQHQGAYMPMPLTTELIAMLEKIKTGKNEEMPAEAVPTPDSAKDCEKTNPDECAL